MKRNMEQKTIYSPFFHRPDPVEFERFIQWHLKHNFRFISTQMLDEILKAGKVGEDKLVWLTFDDGWKNNYHEIWPILEKYNIPATIFVSTNLIDQGYFWLENARLNRKLFSFPPDKLKTYAEKDRQLFMQELMANEGYKESPREFMTWEELKAISHSPLVSIGNHTHNHVICTHCNPSELEHEIATAHSLLEEKCKNYISAFAYPNGNSNDVTQDYLKPRFKVIALVENVHSSAGSDCQSLTRVCLGDRLSMEENLLHYLFTREMIKFKSRFKRSNT